MTVYLVGAGPGDPGLLTVRAAEVLASAQVVVYDRLSVRSLLELAPATAELISVGKAPGRATVPQEEINQLLVDRGLAGQEVVRLKGGDPFVFARGGEEAQALLDAGVEFEVVPGITSAIVVPAYAGIPLTMRHSSTSFTVITGHEDPDKAGEIDWESVARVGGTIVILMGVARFATIAKRLVAGGLAPTTPAAAIRWGTRPEQSTVRATLATLADHALEPPATIVIGKVAALDLGWFERRPLFGRRIVVTRPAAQASVLSGALRAVGAEPVELATVRITDAADGGTALATAIADLSTYDWLVLTSANAVERVMACCRDARDLAAVQIAVVGAATADALRMRGVEPDLLPERFVAESLLAAFPMPPADRPGRVLLARAAEAREVLPEGLRAVGWDVQIVEAYRTEPVALDADALDLAGSADAITFTSGSGVASFIAAGGRSAIPAVVACIGPVTADAAREHGLTVEVVAEDHTMPGLVDALVAYDWDAPDRPEEPQ